MKANGRTADPVILCRVLRLTRSDVEASASVRTLPPKRNYPWPRRGRRCGDLLRRRLPNGDHMLAAGETVSGDVRDDSLDSRGRMLVETKLYVRARRAVERDGVDPREAGEHRCRHAVREHRVGAELHSAP